METFWLSPAVRSDGRALATVTDSESEGTDADTTGGSASGPPLSGLKLLPLSLRPLPLPPLGAAAAAAPRAALGTVTPDELQPPSRRVGRRRSEDSSVYLRRGSTPGSVSLSVAPSSSSTAGSVAAEDADRKSVV